MKTRTSATRRTRLELDGSATALFLVCGLACGLAACGDDGSSSTDADSQQDSATDDTSPDSSSDAVTDAVSDTSADSADSGPTDAHDEDVPTTVDDFGFAIRVPQTRTVEYEQFDGTKTTTEREDIDHVCHVVAAGLEGHLYVRANPQTCRDLGGCDFAVTGAWLSVGGTVTPVEGVSYDYGGNHHNDSITLPRGAQSIKLYHSSFGFGFRSCAPPDCAQVYDGASLTTDGCTTDRTLPSPCVRIAADGTEPAIPTSFEKCNGDPNR